MSQVVVTEDTLKERRAQTHAQEKNIDRESGFAKWRMSDVTKPDPFARLVGLAVLPIVGIWFVLTAVVTLAVTFASWICRALGGLFRK